MHLSPHPPPSHPRCLSMLSVLRRCSGSVVVDLLLIATPIMGFCNCSMFCCALLYVHSSFAINLMGKRELVALLSLSSWCLLIVAWLFLAVPWVFLQFVIMVFPDLIHLLFFIVKYNIGLKLFSNRVYQNLYFMVI